MPSNAYIRAATLFTNLDFQQGVAVCLIKNLAAVQIESAATPNHTNRLALANKVLVPGQQWANALKYVPIFLGQIIVTGGRINQDGTVAEWDATITANLNAVANSGV